MVQPVEPLIVHLEDLQPRSGHPERDGAVVSHLGEVPHPAEEPVGDPRRAARAPGDLGGRVAVHRDREDPGGPHHDLRQVVRRAARLLNADVTDEGAHEIARRSRGTPRIAGRLLRRVRDFAAADGAPLIDKAAAASALARLDVDEHGLDALDRRYLRALIENYAGGPAGVETLAYAIAEARDAVEDVIEPFLLQQGFIQRTPRGRMACAKAYSHLGLAAPKGVGQPSAPDLFE